MLLRQMKYFVSVVETKNFTEAAERNFISQSAVSQQLQALEEELGVRLIIRERRKFSVTEEGEYFYRRAVHILDEIERAKREIKQLSGGDKNLRIGYLKQFSATELQTALSQYATKYPDSEISVVRGTHEDLYNLLRTGQIDIAVNDQRRAFSENYVNFHLVTLNYCIEISAQSSIGNLDYVTAEDLQHMPCIIVAQKEQRDVEKKYYADYLGICSDLIIVDSVDEARLMVSGNTGFTLSTVYSCGGENNGIIRAVPFYRDGKQVVCGMYAFWKKSGATECAEAFAKILYKQFNKDAV